MSDPEGQTDTEIKTVEATPKVFVSRASLSSRKRLFIAAMILLLVSMLAYGAFLVNRDNRPAPKSTTTNPVAQTFEPTTKDLYTAKYMKRADGTITSITATDISVSITGTATPLILKLASTTAYMAGSRDRDAVNLETGFYHCLYGRVPRQIGRQGSYTQRAEGRHRL